MRTFLAELGLSVSGPTTIFSDSQGSIALSKNPEYHQRTKHIDVQHHFVREQVAAGTVGLTFVPTGDMAADFLTKAIEKGQHWKCAHMVGLRGVN